jgi:hypothetical protein
MASSNPVLNAVDMESEVPPNNTFVIDVEAAQGSGGDPWVSSGSCTSQNLDVTAWVTPVTLWVDGSRRGTQELCIANNNSKDTQFSLSLSEGSHDVEVRVHPVGDVHGWGETWEDNLNEYGDDVRTTITTSEEAPDPSQPQGSDKLLRFLEDVADALGTSVNMVAVGIVAAAGVFILL